MGIPRDKDAEIEAKGRSSHKMAGLSPGDNNSWRKPEIAEVETERANSEKWAHGDQRCSRVKQQRPEC